MKPAGTVKSGSELTPLRANSHISAIFTVFARASVIPKPLFVADVLAGADAEQDVVRMPVGLPQIMHVVRAHERQAEIARDGQQSRIHDALFVDPLVLHLEKEIAGP